MRTLVTLLLLCAGACGDDDTRPADVGPDADLDLDTSYMIDTADTSPTVDPDAADVAHDVVGPGYSLQAAAALPGHLVAVRVDDPDRARASLALDGHDVRLHRGVGVLTVTAEDAPAGVAVRAFDAAVDLRVEGERVVAAGETLTIAAGARVVLGAGARLVVHGTLVVAGTAQAQVLFVADDASRPWAAIDVRAGGRAELTHAWLVAGGADADRFGGHSGSDPLVAVVGGALVMTGGGIVDGPGKALYTEDADVSLDGVVIARCDTGGEHVGSRTAQRRVHVFEIPDADGRFDDDDNDAVYLRLGTHTIEDAVYALGEDDAIDHNGATVDVRRVWIEGFRHEGVAASEGGVVRLEDVVVRDAAQGIEAGYGAPEVHVSRAFVTGCGVGLRWGDEYAWEISGTLAVDRSVVVDNDTNVRTDDPQAGEAPAGHVAITCSAVDTPAWDDVGGNIAGAPDASGACPPALVACDGPIGPEVCP